MKRETLEMIHMAYQQALAMSSNLLEIAENLYKILSKEELKHEEDEPIFDSFLDGLRGCIQNRRKTFEIINVSNGVICVIMYIVLWLNATENFGIDLEVMARCKSLESDLTKLLKKSNSQLSANIRDRFGIKCIIWNQMKEEKVEKIIRQIYDCLAGILAGKNRKMRMEFEKWVEENTNIIPFDKMVIQQILNTPFSIDFIKDYIQSPKENGYRSLQFTMTIQMYSSNLPGCQFEIQLKSKKMEDEAEFGKANHEEYKRTGGVSKEKLSEEDMLVNEVFTADDFSKFNIVGFTGYKTREEDVDGIHFPRIFANRRISSTLVPHN